MGAYEHALRYAHERVQFGTETDDKESAGRRWPDDGCTWLQDAPTWLPSYQRDDQIG
jgi:hypothetical protein